MSTLRIPAKFGWAGRESVQRALEAIGDSFPHFFIAGQTRSTRGAKVHLWDAAKKVNGGKHLPTFFQMIGDCFPRSTMIRMADGSEQPIELVKTGDLVISHLGEARRVVQTIKKPYSGDLVTIRTGAPRSITSTPDHRFVRPIVCRSRKQTDFIWAASGDLETGDNVLLPYSTATGREREQLDLAYLVKDQKLVRRRGKTKPSGVVAPHGKSALAVFPEYATEVEHRGKRRPHQSMAKMTDLGLAVPIKSKSVERVEATTVYCLGVEEDHSFIANGYAVHNCVSMGASNAIDYLSCVQIVQGTAQKYRPCFQPYVYGISRVQIGGGQLGNQDGSNGVWAADGLRKYGCLWADEPGVPPYSGQVAQRWGAGGPPTNFIQAAKPYLLGSTAQVNNYTQVRDALANWYPVTVASNRGFRMTLQVDRGKSWGVPSGSWPHQMCFIGVDDDPARPGCYVLNSWGPDSFGPPADDAPPGGFWVDAEVVDSMAGAGDSWVYSQFHGCPEQIIDFMLIGDGTADRPDAGLGDPSNLLIGPQSLKPQAAPLYRGRGSTVSFPRNPLAPQAVPRKPRRKVGGPSGRKRRS